MPRLRDISVGADATLYPFKTDLSFSTIVGIGALLSTILGATTRSSIPSAILCAVLIGPALLNKLFGFKKDPLSEMVLPGRKTAIIKGDFVVFLIGARANRGIDSFLSWMGDAMGSMQRELEDDASLGCLGIENYAGPLGAVSIQYWRNPEALQKYARSKMHKHFEPWKKLAAKGKETSDYAFWHETFLVKDGQYETIYVNCPPMLLANSREVEIVDAKGKYKTATGRKGETDGSDVPPELEEEMSDKPKSN